MPDTLRFISPTLESGGTQAVYWKARWQDEWILVDEMWCSEATWASNPSISAATLRFRYGISMNRFLQTFGPVFRARNRLQQYVRVDFVVGQINPDDESPLTRRWYGILEAEMDELDGPWVTVDENDEQIVYATGKNHFVAYGLESLLDRSECRTSRIQDTDPYDVGRALDFISVEASAESEQHPRPPNRAASAGEAGVFLFHCEKTGGESWTTKNSVEYLLRYDTPRDHNGDRVLEFELVDPDEVLPNWDTVSLRRDGRTPWELLNALLARQRFLGFRITPEETESGAGGKIRVIPFTFASEDLVLESIDGAVFRANNDQKILALEKDRGATVSLKRSSLDEFDQVIVQGAPKTSTAPFSYEDSTLADGWSVSLESAYEAGASGEPDYPDAAEIGERQGRNFEARQLDKFKPVYARFVLPDPFDGYVGDGESGLADLVLMPSDADPDEPARLAPEDGRFLGELPLLAGYDYSGTTIADGNPTEAGPSPHLPLKPMVFFRRPDWAVGNEKYRHAEGIGILSENEILGMQEGDFWSATVRVDHHDGALWINVGIGGQESIAATAFTRLPEDPEVTADYQHMIAVLTVPWSEHVQAIYPEEAPTGRDIVRTLTLIVGDQCRLDYVVPGCVVGIDAAGELIRSTSGGYVRDDRPQLKALAKLAWQWYGQPRHALTLTTSLTNNALEVGDLIVSVGDPDLEGDVHVDDVNSVITSIRITMPLAEGEGPLSVPIPRMTYETAFAELDILKLG